MKIGILTFHRAINYGAFLQAYALKKFIESLGYDVSIIDYWPNEHSAAYNLFPPASWWKVRPLWTNIKATIYTALCFHSMYERKIKMERLMRIYLNLPQRPLYKHKNELNKLSYDCIIYGSDQIWWKSSIPNYEGFDDVYWGEHISKDIKKIAYAPSMGIMELNAKDRNFIREKLPNFYALSARETSLSDIIKQLTFKTVDVVLDPVFLIPSKEWEHLCKSVNEDKYILYYNLIPSKEGQEQVDILCKHFGCRFIELTGRVNALKRGKRYQQTLDAIEFISLIKNATFIITSSFHGVAFSILFHKDFYTIGLKNQSGRAMSLLTLLGIQDRLLVTPATSAPKCIDYKTVDEKLEKMVNISKNFICSQLKNAQ